MKEGLDYRAHEHVIVYQGAHELGTLKRSLDPKQDSRFRFYPAENLNWLAEDALRSILRRIQETPRRPV